MSKKSLTRMERVTNASQKAIGVLLGLILASFMCIIFAQTISRYVFESSIWWSEEISRYLFIWLIMLGVNVAICQNDMLRLEIIDMLLPGKSKKVMDVIVSIIGLIAICILLYCSLEYFKDLGSNQIAPTLGIQIRYVVLCLPIGMLLCIWTQLLVIADRIKRLLNKNHDVIEGGLNDVG